MMILKNKKISAIILITAVLAIVFLYCAPTALAISFDQLNPLKWAMEDGKPNIPKIIGQMILAVLGVSGSFALFMFVYGGFYILTSAGSTEKIKKGKNILIWATIGIIVILASYTLVNFVISAFPGAST